MLELALVGDTVLLAVDVDVPAVVVLLSSPVASVSMLPPSVVPHATSAQQVAKSMEEGIRVDARERTRNIGDDTIGARLTCAKQPLAWCERGCCAGAIFHVVTGTYA